MFLRDVVWKGIKLVLGFMLSYKIYCDLDKNLL